MKKLSLIALLAITLGSLNAQVKSVTLDSIKNIIGGAKIYHTEVTTAATDTFYTRVEVAQSQFFIGTTFSSKWVRHIGSGSNTDIIGYPLVDTLVPSFVRIQCTKDTNKVLLKSNNLQVTPKHKIIAPTISMFSKNATIGGVSETVKFTIGYADSAVLTHIVAASADFAYKSTKTWVVKADGSQIENITGLKENRKFYEKWIIQNSFAITELQDTFHTLGNPKKIWLRTPIDSTKMATPSLNSAICDLKGRAISYGISGTTWATIGGSLVSNVFSLTGIGEEWYTLNITGLTPNTKYTIWVHGKNAKGEDSFQISITTPKYFNPKFFVSTNLVTGVSDGTAEAYASYNVPKGQTANITVGLFAESDSACTQALQDSTYTLPEGTGQLYKKFTGLKPGVYWIWFWGTCTDGQYVLTPAPLKLSIWSAGVWSITTPVSVYPNPCNDFLHLSSSCPYDIYNEKGQIVLKGKSSEIDVSQLPVGKYIFKTGNLTKQFQKN